MNLYEIDHALLTLYDKLAEDGGEIDTATEAELDALEMAFENKVRNIALYIKNLSSEAEAIKAERDKLMIREKSKKNRAESLKKYLSSVLDGKKMEGSSYAISFRKSEVLPENITEETAPSQFVNEIITKKLDVMALKKAVKTGEVNGIGLVIKTNIQIK